MMDGVELAAVRFAALFSTWGNRTADIRDVPSDDEDGQEILMRVATLLKTRRLYLKRQSLQDFDRYFAMSKDPLVMRYIGDGSVFHWTREVALEKFKGQLGKQVGSELVPRAVYTRGSHRYLGWCGVTPSRFLNDIELDYRYCRDAWGVGYATEAAAFLLAEIYCSSEFNRILACAHPQNGASIRVLQKLGFVFTGSKPSNAGGGDIPVFSLDRSTFRGISAGD